MLRTTVLLAAATAAMVLSLPAAAQDRDGGYDRFREIHGMRSWDAPGRGWADDDRADRQDRRNDRSRAGDDDEDAGRGDGRGDTRRQVRSGGRGASFMLRAGDTQLVVRCGRDESMRACVDAATTLLDRARSPASETTGRPGAATPPATQP